MNLGLTGRILSCRDEASTSSLCLRTFLQILWVIALALNLLSGWVHADCIQKYKSRAEKYETQANTYGWSSLSILGAPFLGPMAVSKSIRSHDIRMISDLLEEASALHPGGPSLDKLYKKIKKINSPQTEDLEYLELAQLLREANEKNLLCNGRKLYRYKDIVHLITTGQLKERLGGRKSLR